MSANELDVLIGQRLKEIRDRKGLSLNDVAERIGKAKSTYRDYEIGKSRMFWDVLIDICRVLDIDYSEFVDSVQKEYNSRKLFK